MSVSIDGQSITYTRAADVQKQIDLRVAEIESRPGLGGYVDYVISDAADAVDDTDDMDLTPSTPVATHLTLVGGTSVDDVPIAGELNLVGMQSVISYPIVTDERLLIGYLDSEGPITSVLFSNDTSRTNQLGVFTQYASPVVVAGRTYNVLVGNELVTTTASFTATVT